MRGKIWRAIFWPMTALVIFGTLISAFFYYNLAQSNLKGRVDNLAASSVYPIEWHIWQYDLEAAQTLLDSYVRLGAVSGAQITDGELIDITSGNFEESKMAYMVEVPLFGAGASSGRQIATMKLEVSTAELWQEVLLRISVTFLVSVLFVFMTAVVMLRMISRNLLQPILNISQTLEKIPDKWQDLKIDIDLGFKLRRYDEVSQLVDAIHSMRDKIITSHLNRETSEQKLARAARLARLGYASFDLIEDRFVECDAFFAENCNMSIEQVLAMEVGRDFFGHLLRFEDPQKLATIRERLRMGRTCERVLKYSFDSGELRFVRQILQPTPHPITGRLLVEMASLDITDQRSAEEQLVQAQKLDALGKLTGGVAHDFNNLLAVISGNIELSLLSVESERERAYLETALSAVTSGANLTQQLLSYARKQPLSPVAFDAARIVKQSGALLRTSVGDAIDLEIIASGGLWDAYADPEKLKTTLLNLVVNGRDAMPQGGALTIEVNNCRLDREYARRNSEVKEGQYVCITVTDSGQGMAEQTIERAIEPFFTTKAIGRGTGLGLPMAFGFAKQSGGHLKIYSEVGKGTSVKLYLPRAKFAGQEAVVDNIRPHRHKFKGMTVFVVEDNADLCATYESMLEVIGCTVYSAVDGPAAVNIAKTLPHVDLILTDVMLPGGMDGKEVAKQLGGLFPNAAIIFMSGFTENSIIHNGRLDEGVILLQKPFTSEDLISAILSADSSL